jgi:hypothetical protein
VRDDSAGFPGRVIAETLYQGGNYPAWDRIGLSQPYYDMNSFWITGRFPKPPFVIADSACNEHRSYYTLDKKNWLAYTAGDLMIRAIVTYGDTFAHDVSVTGITALPTGVRVDSQYSYKVSCWNFGSSDDTFKVAIQARDSLGAIEFDTLFDSIAVDARHQTLVFGEWTPKSYGQAYSFAAIAILDGDMNPANDSLITGVCSYLEGELSYDDFSSEVWLNVNRNDNDKFGVKFALPYSPCYVTGARFYVDDTLTFDNLSLCPQDSTKLPDTVNAYEVAYGIAAEKGPSWAWLSFDTSLTQVDADTVWLVLTWPDSKSGPFVGSDRDYPVDGKSWAYSDSTGWKRWASSDFMMRIVCSPLTGMEEAVLTGPDAVATMRVSPNPFSSQTKLVLSGCLEAGHGSGGNSLEVRDASGRCVKRFGDSEVRALLSGARLTWRGTDDRGHSLPSGVYFAVLRMPRGTLATKTVLIR